MGALTMSACHLHPDSLIQRGWPHEKYKIMESSQDILSNIIKVYCTECSFYIILLLHSLGLMDIVHDESASLHALANEKNVHDDHHEESMMKMSSFDEFDF